MLSKSRARSIECAVSGVTGVPNWMGYRPPAFRSNRIADSVARNSNQSQALATTEL
jgi:hypothetical protein